MFEVPSDTRLQNNEIPGQKGKPEFPGPTAKSAFAKKP